MATLSDHYFFIFFLDKYTNWEKAIATKTVFKLYCFEILNMIFGAICIMLKILFKCKKTLKW